MLMGLLKRFIRNDLAELNAHGVRVRVIGERDNLTPDIVALHRRGRDADGEQPRAHPDGRVQLRGASRDRRRGAAHGDRRSRRASGRAGDRSERHWPSGSTPPAFPIRTSSSARRAKCACRISCCGRRPTPNLCSCRSCGLISTMRLSSPRSINMRRASGGLAPWSNLPLSSRPREAKRMAVTGGDPTLGSAPAAAPAVRPGSQASRGRGRGDGLRCAGGGMDWRLCLRGVLVGRVDCRPVGMATARRRSAALRAGGRRRSCACARFAVGLAQFDPLGRGGARSRRGRGRLARGTQRRHMGGCGPALRRRARRQPWAAQGQPELRPGCNSLALCGRLGSGHRGLFRRSADRGPEALADRIAGQDLVRSDRRRVRRGRPRTHRFGLGRTTSRRCSGSGSRRRLSPNLATCSNLLSNGVSASRIRAASSPGTAD